MSIYLFSLFILSPKFQRFCDCLKIHEDPRSTLEQWDRTIFGQNLTLSVIVRHEVAAFPHFCTAFKATMLTQTHVVYELYIRHVKTASPHGTICCFTWSCEKQQALDYKPFERFCLFAFVDSIVHSYEDEWVSLLGTAWIHEI